MIPRRISSTAALRPEASEAVGCRHLSTDTGVIAVSDGYAWIAVTTLARSEAQIVRGGLLASRPEANTCIGLLYTDEDGYDYEAFPGGWAQVNLIEDDVPAIAEVTATADGLTTGIIPPRAKHVVVTSGNADHIVVLPEPVVGKQLVIDVGANGFELRSSAPATIAINGGSGSAAESAIPANSTIFAVCLSATAWKAVKWDADSDVAKVEAAA